MLLDLGPSKHIGTFQSLKVAEFRSFTHVVCVECFTDGSYDIMISMFLVISQGKRDMVTIKPKCSISSKYLASLRRHRDCLKHF